MTQFKMTMISAFTVASLGLLLSTGCCAQKKSGCCQRCSEPKESARQDSSPDAVVQRVIKQLEAAPPVGIVMVDEKEFYPPDNPEPTYTRTKRYLLDGEGNVRQDIWYEQGKPWFFTNTIYGQRIWQSKGEGDRLEQPIKSYPLPLAVNHQNSEMRDALQASLGLRRELNHLLGRSIFGEPMKVITEATKTEHGITAKFEVQVKGYLRMDEATGMIVQDLMPNARGTLHIDGPDADGNYVLREVRVGQHVTRYENHIRWGDRFIPSRVVSESLSSNGRYRSVRTVTSVSDEPTFQSIAIKDHVAITPTHWNKQVFEDAISSHWYDSDGAESQVVMLKTYADAK